MSDQDVSAEPDRIASLIYFALGERRLRDAADLAEANWSVLVSHNVGVLRAVADQLTPEELAERPAWDKLRRLLGFMLLDPSVRPITYIDTATTYAPRSVADVLLTLTTRAIAARTAGHFAESVEVSRTAQRRLDEASHADRDAMQPRLADAYLQWGLSYEFAGLETEALAAYECAYDLGVGYSNTRVATDAAGQLAWLHALAGRGHTADKWITKAQTLAAVARSTRSWRRNDIMASALRQADQLRPDLAVETMGKRTDGAIDEHRMIAYAQLSMFRLSAGRTTPDLLVSELRRAVTTTPSLAAEENENTVVMAYVSSLVHLYGDRPERAIELLEDLADHSARYTLGLRAATHLAVRAKAEALRDADRVIANYGHWPRQLVPALLVKAVTALEDGEREAAASFFTDACRVAVDKDIVSSLVVIPHSDYAQLLELAGERAADPAITALARTPLLFAPPRRAAVKLSPRELQVLRELARGGTLAEVAGRLHLSLNTLKVHNQAIYRKLGAEGRDQAVDAARLRGLI